MASTFGGSGNFGGHPSRERRPAVGTAGQAEQPGAIQRARVSAGASRSGVSSSGEDGVRTIFRSVLTKYVMETSKGYVRHELLTEAAHLKIVHKVVDKIIGYHQVQIPETEKSMQQYISENKEKIKKCVKEYVEKLWQDPWC